MSLWTFPVKLAAGFLIGAIPFAVVAMWGTGIDIRKVGSRNPGFNNVLRVGSKWRAAITLAGDVCKGALAIFLLSAPGDPKWVPWALGLAAVTGHCWSPFLKFNGGKGVATMVGVLLFLELDPRILRGYWIVACLALYPLLRLLGRRRGWTQEGAIASLSTMFVISVLIVLTDLQSGLFASAALGIITLRHTPNLREIFEQQ
jgi:acyl phosphate:glycerol-3-phosphate acyltransferase